MSRAQPETIRAVLAAVLAGLEPLRAVAPMRLSEWVAKEFKLSAEASHTDAFSNGDMRKRLLAKGDVFRERLLMDMVLSKGAVW